MKEGKEEVGKSEKIAKKNEQEKENESVLNVQKETKGKLDISFFKTLEESVPNDWKIQLQEEFGKKYWLQVKDFLCKENGKVFPPPELVFNSLKSTPWDNCKVVIIGQDPYHGPGQAMGLCFSVPRDVAVPPSLKNIYKELAIDIPGFVAPKHGDLTKWTHEGVLLLNASLTVRSAEPNSHSKIGWDLFTDAIIAKLNKEKENLVFILWGGNAHAKGANIDSQKHLVLKSPHPSGLSANKKSDVYPNGFFNNNHFSKTNEYLVLHNKAPIDWKLK